MTAQEVLPHLLLALRLALGLVFALAVIPKLRRPLLFAQGVVEYRILPAPLAFAFGLTLLPVEALLAVALLGGLGLGAALPAASLVLAVFLVAVGINLRRGRKISCGCLGRGSEEISPRTAVRLSLLLAVALALTATREAGLPAAEPSFHDAACTLFLAVSFLLFGAWALRGPELRPVFRAWRRPRRPRPADHLHAVPE
ncbi:MAG TPA: MauE/DoxX family redox-associated membrane protein [Thermoanaerobaculia bacterium]|nr:MauE/DoxX family redox-associated membrane protein [Thermoanaerobaculia bacterium]